METDHERGILSTVPSQFVVRAMYSLPPPDEARPAEVAVEMFVPQVGRVRITFELAGPTSHKRTHWRWLAKSADWMPTRA